MNIFKINTTAYDEEDFFIQANLTEQQIIDVIKPIVEENRLRDKEYTNQDLAIAISKAHPSLEIVFNQNPIYISI